MTIVTINENEKLPVGCGLLFERENCLSLYCLGTVPDHRNEGIARNTLIKALEIAYKKKYQSIFLQTFQKDEYIGMYKKMKFKIVNKREVFSNKEI